MKKYPSHPPRLVELSPDEDPAQLAPLVRSAIDAPAEPLPRVKWRIRDSLRPRGRRQPSRMLRLALVGTCMFVAGGVVGAAVQPLWRAVTSSVGRSDDDKPISGRDRRPRRAQLGVASARAPASVVADDLVAPPAPPVAVAQASLRAPVAPARAAMPAVPAKAPTVAPARQQPTAVPGPTPAQTGFGSPPVELPVLPAPPRGVPPAPAFPAAAPIPAAVPAAVEPTPPTQAPPGPPAPDEHKLLALALDRLRTARDPQAALSVLDQYRASFPGGVLAPEAARLRTEALLLLGRKTAVLDELDRTPSAATPAGDERLLVRAELRAAAGRWRAALDDFDAVVGLHASDIAGEGPRDSRTRERIERALWGRASARSRVDDDAGARVDLGTYLRLFPDGRFSAQARRLLTPR